MRRDRTISALICACATCACLAACVTSAAAYTIVENDFFGTGSLRFTIDTFESYYVRCSSSSLNGSVSTPPSDRVTVQNWSASGCSASRNGTDLGLADVQISTPPSVVARSSSTVEIGGFTATITHRSGASTCHIVTNVGSMLGTYTAGATSNQIAMQRLTNWYESAFPIPPNCISGGTGFFEATATFRDPQFEVSSIPDPTCDYLFSSSVKMGDMNGDGRVDAFQFASDTNGYAWLSNGTVYTPVPAPIASGIPSPAQIRLGDLDGDGDDDVFRFTDDGTAYVYTSTRTAYNRAVQLGTGFGRSCEMRMADMNGDGKDDIFRFRSDGRGYAWLSTGTSYTSIGLIGTGFGSTYQVRSADIDGDGDDDLFQILDTGVGHAWRSDVTRYTGIGPIVTGLGSAYASRAGDRDGDGDDDLFRFTDDGEGYGWQSGGAGFTYTAQGLFGRGFGYVRQVRVGDIDADGDVDFFQFADTGTGYGWRSDGRTLTYLGQIGTGFGAP